MIPQGTRVYVADAPVDFRKSFDGLAAVAAGVLGKDPRVGGLFVFLNKRGNQIRILFRDTNGWCLLSKRLDQGRFRRLPQKAGRFCYEADQAWLMRYIQDVIKGRQRSRRPASHLRIVN